MAQELELGNWRCLTSSVVLYLVEPKTSFVSKFPCLLNLALIHFGLACLFLQSFFVLCVLGQDSNLTPREQLNLASNNW